MDEETSFDDAEIATGRSYQQTEEVVSVSRRSQAVSRAPAPAKNKGRASEPPASRGPAQDPPAPGRPPIQRTPAFSQTPTPVTLALPLDSPAVYATQALLKAGEFPTFTFTYRKEAKK